MGLLSNSLSSDLVSLFKAGMIWLSFCIILTSTPGVVKICESGQQPSTQWKPRSFPQCMPYINYI